MFEAIIFYMLSFFLITSCLVVVLGKNPVYSVLFLIMAFFNAAGFFVLLKAEFLAMVMVIVYVGAVAVLFLFVVMLVKLPDTKTTKTFNKYTVLAMLLLVIMGVELFVFIGQGIKEINFVSRDSSFVSSYDFVFTLGTILFNEYYYILLICALILTVAMIGVVVIVSGDMVPISDKQDPYIQNIRGKERTVYRVKVDNEEGIQ